jgi:hypothetical protein
MRASNIGLTSIDKEEILSYFRGGNANRMLVVHNLCGEEMMVELKNKEGLFKRLVFTTNPKSKVAANTLTLPPYATAILMANGIER